MIMILILGFALGLGTYPVVTEQTGLFDFSEGDCISGVDQDTPEIREQDSIPMYYVMEVGTRQYKLAEYRQTTDEEADKFGGSDGKYVHNLNNANHKRFKTDVNHWKKVRCDSGPVFVVEYGAFKSNNFETVVGYVK